MSGIRLLETWGVGIAAINPKRTFNIEDMYCIFKILFYIEVPHENFD